MRQPLRPSAERRASRAHPFRLFVSFSTSFSTVRNNNTLELHVLLIGDIRVIIILQFFFFFCSAQTGITRDSSYATFPLFQGNRPRQLMQQREKEVGPWAEEEEEPVVRRLDPSQSYSFIQSMQQPMQYSRRKEKRNEE